MARISALAIAAGAGLLAAGGAPAAAETQPFSVSGTGSGNDVLTDTINFDKFDTSLGTLTGVVFGLSSSDSSQSVTFSLSGGEGGSGAGETSVNFLATGPGNGGPITLFSGTGTADANCDSPFGALCSATDDTVSNPTFTTPATVNGALDLPFYEGSGTFAVDVALDSLAIQTNSCNANLFDDPPNCTTTGSAAWSGDITVSFQYTPSSTVPEPGTAGLLAAALGGLAMLARRRRAHSV